MNQAIGRVNHIVHLPHVDESTFQQSYQKAWLESSKTIGLLHAFDREQTSALNETKSPLHTMKQYIDTLSKMFTDPKIEINSPSSWCISLSDKENGHQPAPVKGIDQCPQALRLGLMLEICLTSELFPIRQNITFNPFL
ncbi:hypothetical protein QF033_002496 [Bacillus pumilus]|nr:hypothetical protein [Bacillus pumilus]